MIETQRLHLRRFDLSDAPFVYLLMNSEGWIKNIGDRNIKTIEDAEKYIETKYFDSYNKFGYGPYLVTLKETGSPIGSAGIYKRENLLDPDIGYVLMPEFWNQGFALEAAGAVLRFASEKLQLKKLMAITLPSNQPSINLLGKLGFSEIGKYKYEDGETLLLFSN